MTSHRDALPAKRPLRALPVQPDTAVPAQLPAQYTDLLPEQEAAENEAKSAAGRFPLPAQETERTEQSRRAEEAYRDWADVPDAERPLAAPRLAHASALFAVLKSHGVSILRFADMIGINERQARKYLEARSPIPTTLLDALPVSLADDFAARLRAARSGGPRTGADVFRAALAALEREGASPEVIAEGHMRLGALAAKGRR